MSTSRIQSAPVTGTVVPPARSTATTGSARWQAPSSAKVYGSWKPQCGSSPESTRRRGTLPGPALDQHRGHRPHRLLRRPAVIPDVPNSLVHRYLAAGVGTVLYQVAGLPVLDGSRSQCRWQHDPVAIELATFGPAQLPGLTRPDFRWQLQRQLLAHQPPPDAGRASAHHRWRAHRTQPAHPARDDDDDRPDRRHRRTTRPRLHPPGPADTGPSRTATTPVNCCATRSLRRVESTRSPVRRTTAGSTCDRPATR